MVHNSTHPLFMKKNTPPSKSGKATGVRKPVSKAGAKPAKKQAGKPSNKSQPKTLPIGRPTKYDESMVKQVQKLAKLGLTDDEMADVLDVHRDTFYTWKKEHPDFSDALKMGKAFADANVAQRLYERAMGFEHDSEEIKVLPAFGSARQNPDDDSEDADVSTATGDHPRIVRVPIRKIFPPDTTACIFWLKNRQPKIWRDKVEQELNHNGTIKFGYGPEEPV